MKVSIPALLVSICTVALGQGAFVTPTQFEEYVSAPSAVVQLSEQTGRISSSDAIVDVTALIVEDMTEPASRMRGVRLELKDNSSFDRVYLDEKQLAVLKRELASIEKGIPSLEHGSPSQYRVQGTGACWMPQRPIRILCPSYRVGPDWSGLTLGAYGGPMFGFPGHRPSELSALIDLALTGLAGSQDD